MQQQAAQKGVGADVIIVGGGHNGLVAACYLARAGVDVLVVEAYEKLGGMTSTSPMTPEAPEHMINDGSIQASLWNSTTIDADLELSSKYGLRPVFTDPFHVHLAPGGESLAFWRDYRKTAEEIRYFSPKDAQTWLKYCETIDKAVSIGLPLMRTSPVKPEFKYLMQALGATFKAFGQLRNIARWMIPSFAEAVEIFELDLIRGAFTQLVPFQNYRSDLGGWSTIYFGLIHRYGACLFEGGTGSLPLALTRCLEAAGGRIRTNAPVEALTYSGGRVTGVRLRSGEELVARKAVMTTLNAKRVLTELLPPEALNEEQHRRVRHIPTLERGMADFNINFAFKGRLSLPRHQKWRKDGIDLRRPCVTWNTYQEALDAYVAANRGEVPAGVMPGLAQITTAIDPNMAPPGHDTLWYWCGVGPARPRDSWDTVREQLTQRAVKDMSQYYEGIEDLQIAHRTQVVPDLAKRFHAVDGNVFHVDTFITRMGPLKPALGFAGYRTPVPGLYLSGGSTHPVAGICGLPGQNAARVLLRDLR
ncbi:MAG: NAD(P)/FAD-dependent oxidoreductase [Sinobacteraceae bacterium]|nr:NAD(P)/FAD-dependent oxidoreductase [Nevskiaceae bacterium]